MKHFIFIVVLLANYSQATIHSGAELCALDIVQETDKYLCGPDSQYVYELVLEDSSWPVRRFYLDPQISPRNVFRTVVNFIKAKMIAEGSEITWTIKSKIKGDFAQRMMMQPSQIHQAWSEEEWQIFEEQFLFYKGRFHYFEVHERAYGGQASTSHNFVLYQSDLEPFTILALYKMERIL